MRAPNGPGGRETRILCLTPTGNIRLIRMPYSPRILSVLKAAARPATPSPARGTR